MIDYHVTSKIHLRLESYYNKGLTPAKAKEIIENIDDPIRNYRKLSTEPSFINKNLIINSASTNHVDIHCIVKKVCDALYNYMACENKEKE